MIEWPKYKLSSSFSTRNKATVIHGGKQYFDLLLRLINEAKESIHIQTYIFGDDETGRTIADALKAAAKRKVSVHLLVDGFASNALSHHFINELKKSGVHFRYFEPLLKSKHFYLGRRMHHKIFVADGKFALVGGVNIADRYNDIAGRKAWLDFALFAEGEIVLQLCVLCWKTWNGFVKKMAITPCEQTPISFNYADEETSRIRMRRNDWVRRKGEVSATYIEMLRTAQHHITIVSSYFLPGKVIRRSLKNAIRRGVKVKVVTAGDSDIMLSKNAERWMYDWLLRNKIELYEYQPTVLHGKMAVCDSKWLTIGSYNVNDISAYASIELNLDVQDPRLAIKVENDLEAIIQNDCIVITSEKHILSKNIFKQFIRWLSYKVIRMLFLTVTFYYKQRS